MKYNIALQLAYDGSDYFGWQKTSLGPSIETTLQHALEQILQEPVILQAASRTDRGVHAEGQWVNFFIERPLVPTDLKKRVNCLLPASIRVLDLKQMSEHFHPTLHAQKKEYHYQVSLSSVQLPAERFYAWHVPYPLELERMREACAYFVGEHDFSSFCNFRKNLNYKDKNRTIESVELLVPQENKLLFVITGDHFLYKMVRNIVGTLIYVGRKKIEPAAIATILSMRQRSVAGVTAPSHGLTLKKIYYPQEFMNEL